MFEKIETNGALYDIEHIALSGHQLTIQFAGSRPAEFGNTIRVRTIGGLICSYFEGFITVYDQYDNTVILSDDKSVKPIPETEPEQPKLSDEEIAQQQAETEKAQQIRELESQINEVDAEFKALDYIGIKIATGRAKKTDYTDEIAKMNELADKKNELEAELAKLKEA